MSSYTLKERLRSHYATFSQDTTFHGFFDLHKSKRWYEKCAWILIMVGCTAMLCYYISMQLSQYLDGEMVTRTTRFPNEDQPYDIPKIVLQLRGPSWIDVAKVEALGFTYEEILVAHGYLKPTQDSKSLVYESEIPVEAAKESLKTKMKNLGINAVSELLSRIAWTKLDGAHDTEWIVLSSFNRDWAFYNLNTTTAVKALYTKTWRYELPFNFTAYGENANRALEFFKVTERAPKLNKPCLYNPDTEQRVPLNANQIYMISVDCSMYRRMRGCVNTSHPHHYPPTCKLDCQLQIDRNAYSCTRANNSRELIEITKSYREGPLNLCHLGVMVNGSIRGFDVPEVRILSEREKHERERALLECEKGCLPKCEIFTSTWSIVTFACDEAEECPVGTSVVSATFPDAKTLVITEEIERYRWHDVVSNIGGLLGLWLGASIMSIFQAIHLCCRGEEDEAKEREDHVGKAKCGGTLGGKL